MQVLQRKLGQAIADGDTEREARIRARMERLEKPRVNLSRRARRVPKPDDPYVPVFKPDDLATLTKKELVGLADEAGIERPSSMTKGELIAALSAPQEESHGD
jgi:hypothetical protein